jgi:hypothetical protein
MILKESLKYYNKFIKFRSSLINNKYFLSIFIYLTLLFVVDSSKVLNLYDQNIVRRVINMYRRLDFVSFKNYLQPYSYNYKNMLDKNDIEKLQSIKIPEKKDTSFFTRKNTTSHQYPINYSKEEIEIIDEIREKLKQKYEKQIGKKLYLLYDKNTSIYRYYGKDSKHLWHVDPLNRNDIYNLILCIKKKGEISPLQCKKENNEIHTIYLEEGDAALFCGGSTVHQVPPNNDDNSERTVLSIPFTSNLELSKDSTMSNNLCTHIQGGNNILNIVKIIMTVFFLNLILTQISGVNKVSYKFFGPYLMVLLLLARFLPNHFDTNLGTNRASSIRYNLVILLILIIATLSVKGAMVFFSYFLISDLFFPRKWVEYY